MYKILEDLAKSLAQSSENPLYHIPYRLLVARGSGYVKQPKPDFDTGIFGWGEYKPKHQKHIIKTISVKDQARLNNCVYQATIAAKEVVEGVELSVKSLTIYAKIKGLLSGDGWSSTDNGEKALRDFGACLEKDLPSNEEVGWERYSDVRQLTPELMEKAKEHRSSTWWSVKSRGDRLKLLDEGTIIKVAKQWFSGFNQGGGFKSPWIITKAIGLIVGGHEYIIKGYIFGYYGRNVYVCQNSYSKLWGDNGDFYVDMDYLDRNYFACTANLDIDRPIADIITQYAQKNVKGTRSNAVYHISMGKKRVYKSMLILALWGVKPEDIYIIPQEEIDKVPEGNPMQAENSPHYSFYEDLEKPVTTKIK